MAQIELRFNPDGTLGIRIPSGVSFEVAKTKIEALVKELGADIPIKLDGQVEQHRHDPIGDHATRSH